jgi:acyl-CoA reductase-like NAD-dependent aldehyde dehydrogenase
VGARPLPPALPAQPGTVPVPPSGGGDAYVAADAAANGVKPVALELGGTSATLVHADCGDLETVADHLTWGITRNAGQLCCAGSHLVVDARVADALLERIEARMAALAQGGGR